MHDAGLLGIRRRRPAAVATVEGIGTYTGTGSPVLTIKTLGDSADPVPLDEAYLRTFLASGSARRHPHHDRYTFLHPRHIFA